MVVEEMKNMEAPQDTDPTATMVPSNDLSHVVKRKRAKRQRPHNNTSSSEGGGYCHNGSNTKNNTIENIVNSTITTDEDISPVTTPTTTITIANEEEVDTAKCLLLLSQGQYSLKRKHDDNFGTVPYKYKLSSKIFLATPTENCEAGIYVYECKTCNRTFPSFQALGGHRTSHRKPKITTAVEERKKLVYSDDEDILPPPPPTTTTAIPIKRSLSTFSLSLHNNANHKSPPKMHECGTCGAEFMSGQALGGHMRRHRGAPQLKGTSTTLCLGPFSMEKDAKRSKGNVVNFSLDLNLPATQDEKKHKFSYPQQQQQKQSPLVMSAAPTLLDCHY